MVLLPSGLNNEVSFRFDLVLGVQKEMTYFDINQNI